jgi:hypothetical protein
MSSGVPFEVYPALFSIARLSADTVLVQAVVPEWLGKVRNAIIKPLENGIGVSKVDVSSEKVLFPAMSA